MFVVGVAVGFVAGARAGRGAYDQMVSYAKQVAGHPKVQQATSAVQAKTTELTKTAAAKAPEAAKNAMNTAATQVPKFASAARHAAETKIPARFGGSRSEDGGMADDGSAAGPDDVGPDGNLIYPADNPGSANGTRYSPDTP
jgi:hypothetical protein